MKAGHFVGLASLWLLAAVAWGPAKRHLQDRQRGFSPAHANATAEFEPRSPNANQGQTALPYTANWLDGVVSTQPPPKHTGLLTGGSRAAEEPLRVSETTEADAFPAVFFGHLRRVKPMCFQQGVGWVWLGNQRRRHIRMKYELKRYISPQGLVPPNATVTMRRDKPAVLLVTPARHIGTLYHLVWPHMSALHTLHHMGSRLNSTDGAPPPLSVYLQGWDGDEGLETAPNHYFRTMLNVYSDELNYAKDFKGQPGAVVCHEVGYAGGLQMHHESRGRGWRGAVPQLGHLYLPSTPAGLLREYSVVAAHRREGVKRLLVLQREGASRTITNVAEITRIAEGEGWSVSVMVLEKFPVAKQYAALSQADMVFQLHGSSMAWVLLVPKGRIFAEMLGVGGSAFSNVLTEPFHVAVNPGAGTYGKLQTSCSFHHFTHLVSNLSYIPVTPQCQHNGVAPPSAWKRCSLRVPADPFRFMVGQLAGNVLADPEGHLSKHYNADIPGVRRDIRLEHLFPKPRRRGRGRRS